MPARERLSSVNEIEGREASLGEKGNVGMKFAKDFNDHREGDCQCNMQNCQARETNTYDEV